MDTLPKPKVAQAFVKNILGATPSMKVVRSALRIAHEAKYGNPIRSFALLPNFVARIEEHDNRNVVQLNVDQDGRGLRSCVGIGHAQTCGFVVRFLGQVFGE